MEHTHKKKRTAELLLMPEYQVLIKKQIWKNKKIKKLSRYYGLRLTSCDVRCYCGFRILPLTVCKTSPGRAQQLSSHVTATVPRTGFGQHWTSCCLGTLVRPCTACYVISVRRFGSLPAKISRLDIRLPSDSTSRWTPLPSANASYCRARCGLSPLSCCLCRAHIE